jgi:hypothetical protein
MVPQKQPESSGRSATLTIPELEQSKATVLNSQPRFILGGAMHTLLNDSSSGIAVNQG